MYRYASQLFLEFIYLHVLDAYQMLESGHLHLQKLHIQHNNVCVYTSITYNYIRIIIDIESHSEVHSPVYITVIYYVLYCMCALLCVPECIPGTPIFSDPSQQALCWCQHCCVWVLAGQLEGSFGTHRERASTCIMIEMKLSTHISVTVDKTHLDGRTYLLLF